MEKFTDKPDADWFNSLHNTHYNEDEDCWEINILTNDTGFTCKLTFNFESVLHTYVVTEYRTSADVRDKLTRLGEAELPHDLTCSQIINLLHTLKAC